MPEKFRVPLKNSNLIIAKSFNFFFIFFFINGVPIITFNKVNIRHFATNIEYYIFFTI